MTNVGALISTPSGLRTVVQVVPGRVNPTLSNVVTQPLDRSSDNSRPARSFGSPLPGRAQSAANFVQTMVYPSDNAPSDTASADASATDQTSASQTGAAQASSTASASTTTQADSQSSSDDVNASMNAPPAVNDASQASQAYAQATSAYQTAQQRNDGTALRLLTVG